MVMGSRWSYRLEMRSNVIQSNVVALAAPLAAVGEMPITVNDVDAGNISLKTNKSSCNVSLDSDHSKCTCHS